jgi:UDP-glucose 4-epimerase
MPPAWEAAYAGRRALVTGGAGFIGSHVARRLVALGAEVAVIDALIPECGGNLFNLDGLRDRIRLEIADLRDRDAVAALARGRDFVFNLAGQVSHIDSMTRPADDLELNCHAHLSLLEACRRQCPAARVVYAGTRQAYGRPLRLPVDEEHPLTPTDVNGINKMAGEAYHLLYHRLHGLRTTSLRLTNTFGPGLLIRHPRQGFLSVFLRRALDDEPIRVYGDGRQLRDLNYVDDVVEAFLAVAAAETAVGRVYNLGAAPPLSLLEVAELVVRVAGSGRVERVPFPDELKRIDIGSYYGDFGRIRRDVGWQPRVPVEEGLRRTLAYYRRHARHYLTAGEGEG